MFKPLVIFSFLALLSTQVYAQSKCQNANAALETVKANGFSPVWLGTNSLNSRLMILQNSKKEWLAIMLLKHDDGPAMACQVDMGTNSIIEQSDQQEY